MSNTARFNLRRDALAAPGLLAAALALVGSWSAATAAVIHNNGAPLLAPTIAQGASFADAANSTFVEAADNFSLAGGTNTIRDIHWWGVYASGTASPPADNFAINIYNTAGGSPGAVLSSVTITNLVRSLTANTITGLPMYKYDAVIADLTVPAATILWLGISNNSGGNGWAWVNSANSGGNARQYSAVNAAWSATTKELAFNLTNDIVPEPSSATTLTVGLAALGLATVFRRARCSFAANRMLKE